MYCKKCGTKNKDDARFCANCGAKLVVPPQQPKQPEQLYTEPQNETKQPNHAGKLSSKNWIIILACVIVVIAVVFAFQYFNSGDKKEVTATTEEKAPL